MMLEKQSMEQAELYALGFLNETESASFERKLQLDHDLQLYLQELNTTMSAIALTAPQKTPPEKTLLKIQKKIHATPETTHWFSRLSLPLWAAAAMVLLSAVSIHQVTQNYSSQQEITELRETLEEYQQAPATDSDPSLANHESGSTSANPDGSASSDPSFPSSKNSTHERYLLTQNLGQLKRQLTRIKEANEARFTPNAGISRMVVIEMLDPSLDKGEKEQRRMVLPTEVSDILASGLDVDQPTGDDSDVHLSGTDNTWRGQIFIEEGMVNLSLVDLPKGQTVIHRNFPLDNISSYEGIDALPNGHFYDRYSDIIWKPGLDGQYVGSRPSQQPDIPDVPELPQDTNQLTDARAFTLFDETTGQGSIIVSNVQEPSEGQVYQLWMDVPDQDQPISLGIVPQLENGSGRIGFELPEPGFSPTNYRLTAEPSGGSHTPTGPTILSGP